MTILINKLRKAECKMNTNNTWRGGETGRKHSTIVKRISLSSKMIIFLPSYVFCKFSRMGM